MSFNSFGNILQLTTFGESHGDCIGGILDGMPAGVQLDFDAIRTQLNRRRPGQSEITTSRNENDNFKILSGMLDNMTTGHSIGFQIENQDQISQDYENIESSFRPSHSDYTYFHKYGIREHRGGGRSSARETANWVLAGAIAKHIIPEIQIHSFVSSIGNLVYKFEDKDIDYSQIESSLVRCPDAMMSKQMIELIQQVKSEGDSVGGIITTIVKNVPLGLGEPIFHKLEAKLGQAMLSINACKGFEIGSGFKGTTMRGSEHNDLFLENGKTKTNFSGGIQGGISNGMDIVFRSAFKPTSTILMDQETINVEHKKTNLIGKGRHDPCVVPRAVPIVDAMTSLVLADMFLLSRTRKISH